MIRSGIRVLLFLLLPLAAFAGAASSASPVRAATVVVSTCDAASLKAAIDSAAAGDTITFACSGTIPAPYSNRIPYWYSITKDLTIDGTGQNVTLDAVGLTSHFSLREGITFTLKGLTLANGIGGSYGNCPTCPTSTYSGAITQTRGTLNIINSTIRNNGTEGLNGGGAIISLFGTLNISNSTFSNNSAYNQGGAVLSLFSTLNISNSTFNANVTHKLGGAVYIDQGTVTISGSTFNGNVADAFGGRGGGGAIGNNGTTTIVNSTFNGNLAIFGGAIANTATINLIHSTLRGNDAENWGNGIYTGGVDLYPTRSGTTNVTNSILSNADVPTRGTLFEHPLGSNCSGPGTLNNGGGNIADDNRCGFTQVATADLKLGSLANNGGPTQTIALQSGSVAINKVACLASATTDQRGHTRPATGLTTCDIGAYEAGAVNPIQTTSLSGISGAGTFQGTATLTARLAVGGTGVAGKSISFRLNGTSVGSATTGSNGVATLSGVSLSGIAGGSYPGAIGVSFAGDGNYTASSGSGTLTVGRAAATITLDASTLSPTYNSGPRIVTATTAPASLSYSVSYNGSATPPTDAGSYAIVATITDSNYTGSVSGTLTVNTADQTITIVTPAPAGASFGTTFAVAATADSGLPVSYAGSGACSNSGDTFTMTSSTGICTVTFAQAGNDNVNAAPSVAQTVTASKADQVITITSTAPTSAAYGETYTPTATGGGSGNPVTFGASGACAYDSGTGVITLIAIGTCTVTADQAGNANYVIAAREMQTFSVAKASLSVAANDVTMTSGDAVPVFDATVTGLANGDDFETLGGTCTAEVDGVPVTSSTPPGGYPAAITCSGVNTTNYSVTYTAGTLTIVEAPVITSDDVVVFNIDEPDSFTVSASGHPAATFTLTGTLPNGVSLSVDGVLSGTPTEIGVFVVTIVASNGIAPDASQTFTVSVVVPEVIAPDNITLFNDPGQAGAVVTYPPATAIGKVGAITCTPSSGSFFPFGTTTVTCTSASGLEDTFTITVEPSTQYLLDGLRSDTITLVTNPTAERALLTTLDRVQQYVNARNPLMAYMTMVQYVVQVEQQVNAKRITPVAARQLLEQAQVLVRSIL